ncbi:Lrp/AsnC family transcriptional regulator, partial [Candidatus Woesearchaeota archaeon]|nr:Lrp/AsnC family transcriptional regulator [Candidatus Woesearchaeota archaeon]
MVFMELDNVDKGILNELLENSRLSYRQIAKKLKISPATVMHRLNNLDKSGFIRGYTITMDYEKLGFDVNVLIEVRVSKGKLFEVEKRIASHPNVFAVYDITGAFDAVIVAKFPNRKSMDTFVKKLQTFEFVERTETKLILNTIKEE